MIVVEVLLASAVTVAVITYVIPIVVALGSALIGFLLGYFLSKNGKDEYDIDAEGVRKSWNARADNVLGDTGRIVSDLNGDIEMIVFQSGAQTVRLDSSLDALESNLPVLHDACANLHVTSEQMRDIVNTAKSEHQDPAPTQVIHELLLDNKSLSDLMVRVSQKQLADSQIIEDGDSFNMRLFA